MNVIRIELPCLEGRKITCRYAVDGEWQEAFKQEREFSVEYSCDISGVPAGVAVIPFLSNFLPIAWVYDAEIIIPICDHEFYDSIEEFKKGYKNMYPMMHFGGKLTVGELQRNAPGRQGGCASFFSGGVDAFNTLVCHADEHPTLITLWGADVKLTDDSGWSKVEAHLRDTANDFEVDYVTIKSTFREFLDEGILSQTVKKSGDNWWHGFQHGIGIISHAAPVMYALEKKTVYFASSFTAADKGKVTCASDPTIDNYVRFCGCNVVHDGYEYNRQMKVHNITQFSQKTGKHIPLRVCWESAGGANCCTCEKCYRTMANILAEGENPKRFNFPLFSEKETGIRMRNFLYHKVRGKEEVARSWLHTVNRVLENREQLKNLPYWDSFKWICQADFSNPYSLGVPLIYRLKNAKGLRGKLSEFKFYRMLHSLKDRAKS